MLNFETSLFAFAGVMAAAGPIIIHLLNRRRFRQVQWAAMDFLRQALERNKRILHLRDLILMALRVLAVLLFGITLARPFYRGSMLGAFWHGGWLAFGLAALFGSAIWGVVAADNAQKKVAATGVGFLALLFSAWAGWGLLNSRAEDVSVAGSRLQPVHAILLIDNSRSLGTEQVGTSLLEQAKVKSREFLAALPADSRMTIIPVAGSEDAFPLEAFRHREEAEKAIERLQVVDTSGSLRRGLDLAVQAARQVTELPTKRAVLLTDLQNSAFREADWGESVQALGGLQIAPVSSVPASNCWISDFQLEDGLAGVESPSRFLAKLQSAGGETSAAVLLRLTVDGVQVASQTVDLSPGQTREIEFNYQFDGVADPERASFSLVELELQSDNPAEDQLAADNRLSLVVPIVAALPVVFIDEYGGDEDLSRNQIGETYALRHLLAPKTAGEFEQRRLIRVIHLRQDQVTQDVLSTARLVIMAGVERPESCVPVLREYALQGGPLLLLAGGRFDPAAWQQLAWLDGRGILPAPLKPESHGVTPEEAPEKLKPFFADYSSMQHDFFLVAQEDPEQMAAIFESTPFFKAVQPDLADATLANLLASETKQFESEQTFLNDYLQRRNLLEQRGRTNSPAETSRQEEEQRRYREIEPAWWLGRSPLPLVDRSLPAADLAELHQPHALAMFTGIDVPLVVDRRIGAGRVVLVTTGVTSDWNLLRASGAMYFFHRMISSLIQDTLPLRNYEAGQRIALPVDRQSDVRFMLTRPSGREEHLQTEALTSEVAGVQIRTPLTAGSYRIRAEQSAVGAEAEARSKLDEWIFAVNGPLSESDLSRISPEELTSKVQRDDVRILGANEAIDLQGGARRGQGLWQWALFAVLMALIAEMVLLAWPTLSRKEAA